MKHNLFLVLILTALTACQQKAPDTEASVDSVEAVVESGLTLMSGIADDQASTTFAARSSMGDARLVWLRLLAEPAWAATCQRALASSCVAGVRSATYNQCELSGTAATLYGNVTLTYSDGACSLSVAGQSVTRSYNVEFAGPRGGKVAHSSEARSDYRGTTYGGGGRLSRTTSGWDLEVLGRNSTLTSRGRTLFDVSVRSLSPISVTGSLLRSSRVLNGGQLEVNHNLAEFSAVLTPNNLRWSQSCCHPTSGSLSVQYSGSRTGGATVNFLGCGSAEVVNQDGQASSIQLSYCE
jgi:hypothetical protein